MFVSRRFYEAEIDSHMMASGSVRCILMKHRSGAVSRAEFSGQKRAQKQDLAIALSCVH